MKGGRVSTETSNGSTTYSYDSTNQITNDSATTYTYDLNGNRTMTGYRQTIAHQVAAVVVHEGNQVHAPVLTLEDKAEQVGLPQLIRSSPFKV